MSYVVLILVNKLQVRKYKTLSKINILVYVYVRHMFLYFLAFNAECLLVIENFVY